MKWNYIILEGFCARLWDYHSKSHKHVFTLKKHRGKKLKFKKQPNPHYDPTIEPPKRPPFCQKHICYGCFANSCEHLATGEGRLKDIIKLLREERK